MRTFLKIICWYLIFIAVIVDSESPDNYQIKYKVKIVNRLIDNILINDCLVTSVPNNYQISKEETDIQFENLILLEDASLCNGPIKAARDVSAVLTTRTSDCGIVQQIRNARASNIKIIIFMTMNQIYVPNLSEEFAEFPIVIVLPSNLIASVQITDFNTAKIGIYGSMGDNRNGIAMTGAIMFILIITTLVLIIMTTIFFNKQHFIHLESVSSIETKNIKWVVPVVPILMIGSLLLLYFFYNVMVWVFISFFFLAAALSAMSLGMLFVMKFNCCTDWVVPLKKFGINNVDFRALGLFVLGLILSTAWIINRNNMAGLVLNNVIGVFLCTEITVGIGIMFVVSKNFKALLLLLAIVLLIDGVMVYIPVGTNKLGDARNDSLVRIKRAAGESIMEKVATGAAGSSSEEVPIRFKVPLIDFNRNLSTSVCQHYGRSYSLLGFGDIIIPGIFIVYILTFSVMTRSSLVLYSMFTLFAYIAGLVITHIIMRYTNRGQPALVFLLPSLVPPTLILTAIKNDFLTLWHHNWPSNQMQALSNFDEEITVKTDDIDKVPL